MKKIAFVAAVAAVFPGIAAAQPGVGPADPAAAAPPPAYRSVFHDLPGGIEQEQVDWRKANADVARFARGHADYVKWEEQQQGAATAPALAPAARPQGHRQH